MSTQQVLQLLKERLCWRGLTVSGGEPLQAEALIELSPPLNPAGFHTVLIPTEPSLLLS